MLGAGALTRTCVHEPNCLLRLPHVGKVLPQMRRPGSRGGRWQRTSSCGPPSVACAGSRRVWSTRLVQHHLVTRRLSQTRPRLCAASPAAAQLGVGLPQASVPAWPELACPELPWPLTAAPVPWQPASLWLHQLQLARLHVLPVCCCWEAPAEAQSPRLRPHPQTFLSRWALALRGPRRRQLTPHRH